MGFFSFQFGYSLLRDKSYFMLQIKAGRFLLPEACLQWFSADSKIIVSCFLPETPRVFHDWVPCILQKNIPNTWNWKQPKAEQKNDTFFPQLSGPGKQQRGCFRPLSR